MKKPILKIRIVCEVMPEIMTACAFIPQGKLARYLSFCYYSDGYALQLAKSGCYSVSPSGGVQSSGSHIAIDAEEIVKKRQPIGKIKEDPPRNFWLTA